ncbi:MAG: cell division protein FtsI [Thermoleophilia bacterium]|nr:cell division protein FtsI [Thermoleophilia bacterium]
MEMNSSIRRLFIVSVILFASLMAMLGYLQVIAADSLAENPQNTRKIYKQMRIERGLILAADRSLLAGNRLEEELYHREYPLGDLAPHLTGYSDPTYGQTGIERSLNSYLTGTADEVELVYLFDTLMGKEKRGADVRLALDPVIQKAAISQLQSIGKRGAVVVLDVNTGAVKAMVSAPSYDPNQLVANWEQLNADPGAPLLNRATQGLYTPGSSLKLITTAAALENGFQPDSSFNDENGNIVIHGNTINNWRDTPFGRHDLSEAFSQSINTTFAQVGDRLGQGSLLDYQQRFGLYEKPQLELPSGEIQASGRYLDGDLASPGDPLDPVQNAWLAIGQENMLVTPLQMAMIAQAIANEGKMMKPYLVDSIANHNGVIIRQTRPEQWKDPISPATAGQLKEMMIKVVNEGTGSRARTSLVQIAGKTGTAEIEGSGPNAWFVGFAPADSPRFAIAVVVEDSDSGGGISGPVARDTLLAALGYGPDN